MTSASLVQQSEAFLEHVDRWFQELPVFSIDEELTHPERAAVFSVDMVVGFCSQGSLASPRVASLIPTVVELFHRAHSAGVRNFVLAQDTHHEDAPEFRSFPPHCVRGTEESQTVPELREMPFSGDFFIVEKNSLHPALGTTLDQWLEAHQGLQDLIVVGDCTDLCTYHLAMHLRLRANAFGLAEQRVIVPANAVDTYELPIEVAKEVGAPPHPGDFFHRIFLYHMALNGIHIVSAVE